MPQDNRDAREEGTADANARGATQAGTRSGGTQDATQAGTEQGRQGKQAGRPAGAGRKNVSVEPPPELSEQGGVEPQERDPSQFHDRTRDRELDEGR